MKRVVAVHDIKTGQTVKQIVEVPDDEIVEANLIFIKEEQRRLLSASDWTQMPDTKLTPEQQTAWREYRHAVRNVDKGDADILNIIWPNPPT